MTLHDVEIILRNNRINYILSMRTYQNGIKIYVPRTGWDGSAMLLFSSSTQNNNPSLIKILFADTRFESLIYSKFKCEDNDDVIYFDGIGKEADSDSILERFMNAVNNNERR